MATIKAKILTDLSTAVGASATVNGAAQAKGTSTDLIVVLCNTGGSGTVTPQLQGSNTSGFGSPVNINPDKANVTLNAGALPALSGATSTVVAKYGQLQYAFYRMQYVSGATSGTTFTNVFTFFPTADSFDETVQS